MCNPPDVENCWSLKLRDADGSSTPCTQQCISLNSSGNDNIILIVHSCTCMVSGLAIEVVMADVLGGDIFEVNETVMKTNMLYY